MELNCSEQRVRSSQFVLSFYCVQRSVSSIWDIPCGVCNRSTYTQFVSNARLAKLVTQSYDVSIRTAHMRTQASCTEIYSKTTAMHSNYQRGHQARAVALGFFASTGFSRVKIFAYSTQIHVNGDVKWDLKHIYMWNRSGSGVCQQGPANICQKEKTVLPHFCSSRSIWRVFVWVVWTCWSLL